MHGENLVRSRLMNAQRSPRQVGSFRSSKRGVVGARNRRLIPSAAAMIAAMTACSPTGDGPAAGSSGGSGTSTGGGEGASGSAATTGGGMASPAGTGRPGGAGGGGGGAGRRGCGGGGA